MVYRLKRFAEALETTDSIPERFTCRTIRLNLEPTPYSPERVKAARGTLRASQAIFAHFLVLLQSAVRGWEQAQNRRGGVRVGSWMRFGVTRNTGGLACENWRPR